MPQGSVLSLLKTEGWSLANVLPRSLRAVLRATANFGLVLLLVTALVSGLMACAPVKSGSCCDPSGHCKRISRSCGKVTVAVLTSEPPAMDTPAAAVESVASHPADPPPPLVPLAQISPPDLCLLHSIFRI